MDALGWPHLLIIFAVIILLFGAAKLPGVAKALGQSVRVFKGEMAKSKAENVATPAAAPPALPDPAASTTPRPAPVAPPVADSDQPRS